MTGKATYALMIYRTSRSELSTESEVRVLQAHRALQAEAAQAGQLVAVARLGDVADAKTVGAPGAHSVMDGPYVETKEWLVGFYLVECDNEQQALERASSICPQGEHFIEVRPVVWRWKP